MKKRKKYRIREYSPSWWIREGGPGMAMVLVAYLLILGICWVESNIPGGLHGLF